MSIKIGTSGSTSKNVIDVKTGVSSSAFKDVDLVKDWNGKIIWQRDKTIRLTETNTKFSLDPWYESDSTGVGLGKSKPYKEWKGDGHIEYNNGSSWITLTEGTHYKVSWTDNRVPSDGYTQGKATGNGKMHITGVASGGYSGTFYRQFYIEYTYKADEPKKYTISTKVSPKGYGSVSGGGSYASGSSCTLTATPATDSSYTYSFTKWNDESTKNPRSFNVTGDAEYTANFERTPTVTEKTISSVEFAGTYCYYGNTTSSGKVYDPAYDNSSVKVTMSDGTTFNFSKNDTGPKSGVSYKLQQGTETYYAKYKNGKAISGSTATVTYNAHTIKYSTVTISCDGTTYTGSATASAYLFYNFANYG